jgi:hypothetical protein
MADKNLTGVRRSTRLSISIPIGISGKDAEGRAFKENVRTLVISKHGAKILTVHQLSSGTEILVENKSLGNIAKATVVWLEARRRSRDLHQVGLQLVEAQNIWGIEFPPDDWTQEESKEERQSPGRVPVAGLAQPASKIETPPAPTPAGESPAGESERAARELTSRILQQIEQSADAHVQSFRDRLERLREQIGLQMEADLHKSAAPRREPEGSPLDQRIQSLDERLTAVYDEVKRLETKVEELRVSVQSAPANVTMTAADVEEARRRLNTLVHSIVESMNRAADAGLKEYRDLLQKDLQEHAARLRAGTE